MNVDSLSELSAVLPAWVPWAGPLLAFVTLAAVYLVVKLVVVRGALRAAAASVTWTERARHVHVARLGAALAALALPAVGGLAAVSFVGPLSAVPRPARSRSCSAATKPRSAPRRPGSSRSWDARARTSAG